MLRCQAHLSTYPSWIRGFPMIDVNNRLEVVWCWLKLWFLALSVRTWDKWVELSTLWSPNVHQHKNLTVIGRKMTPEIPCQDGATELTTIHFFSVILVLWGFRIGGFWLISASNTISSSFLICRPTFLILLLTLLLMIIISFGTTESSNQGRVLSNLSSISWYSTIGIDMYF